MTWTYAEAKKRHEDYMSRTIPLNISRGEVNKIWGESVEDRAELIQLVEKLGEALKTIDREIGAWECNDRNEEGSTVRDAFITAALKELT